MIKFISSLFKVGNIALVIVYLLACLIPFLPPGKFWWIAGIGLVFPLLFFGVVFFFLFWLVSRSKWAWLSLVALILSWRQIAVFAGLHFNNAFEVEKKANTLRILSYNLSSWGETSKDNPMGIDQRKEMISMITSQKADILCFQEFLDTKGIDKDAILPIFKKAGYPYAYYVKTVVEDVHYNLGVAIISKYPFSGTANYQFGYSDNAEHLIYADINFNGKTIRVFTTHLQSVKFEENEYATIRKIRQTDKPGLSNSTTLVKKLKYAYQFRGKQADSLYHKITESPYPVIVCGDFNDVPNSYTYFTVKKGLQDAFIQQGAGLGRTFRYLSPTLRIDYLLVDKNMTVEQYHRIKAPYSDHYPILCDVTINDGVTK